MWVGLTGDKRAGKDSVAKSLERYGFKRYALADKMRRALELLNPDVVAGPRSAPLQALLAKYGGWEGLKASPWGDDARRLMERMGTEVGRGLFGENFWIEQLADEILDAEIRAVGPYPNVVITDIRFDNEADWLSPDGFVVRVTRPGTTKTEHVSSAGISDKLIDYTIHNSGTLEDLDDEVDTFIEYVRSVYTLLN